jgi:hypothetical protein
MCLFQLFVASSRLEIFFSIESAGASSGRSANPRKNRFQNFKAFHFYQGQKIKRLKDLKVEKFNPKQSLNFGIFKYLN